MNQELYDYLFGENNDPSVGVTPINIYAKRDLEHLINCGKMTEKNRAMRNIVLGNIEQKSTFEERINYIKQFFSESFFYDYHLVFEKGRSVHRVFEIDGKKYSAVPSISTTLGALSENIYLTRCAQCLTYTSELYFLLTKLGYETSIKKDVVPCFNPFSGKDEPIEHIWNVVYFDGNEYEIDIVKEIMERDRKILGAQAQSE